MQPMIPPPELTPLPAPAWLFMALLILTFLVHLVFMNLMLGSAVMAAFSRLRARSSVHGHHWLRLADVLMHQLPWHIAFAVTTGIAPLLFVQTLYGPLFYTSTITVGWLWISLLLVIVVAYYAAYAYKIGPFRRRTGQGSARWAYLAALLLLAAALIQVVVNVLQITPERWAWVYQGIASALGEASVIPRYLHFALSAVAFTGLYIAVRAVRGGLSTSEDGTDAEAVLREEEELSGGQEKLSGEEDPLFRRWAARTGVRFALWPTAFQIGIGAWFLLSLPEAARAGLMGGSPFETAVMGGGLVLALGLLFMLVRISDPIEQRGLVMGSAGAMLLTMLLMVLVRDGARRLALAEHYVIWNLPVRTQTFTLLLFIALLLAGLVVLGKTLLKVRKELRAGLDARGPQA